jgi:hypothetical protein
MGDIRDSDSRSLLASLPNPIPPSRTREYKNQFTFTFLLSYRHPHRWEVELLVWLVCMLWRTQNKTQAVQQSSPSQRRQPLFGSCFRNTQLLKEGTHRWSRVNSNPHTLSQASSTPAPTQGCHNKTQCHSALLRFVWSVHDNLSKQWIEQNPKSLHGEPPFAHSALLLHPQGLGAKNSLGHHVVTKTHSRCWIMKQYIDKLFIPW